MGERQVTEMKATRISAGEYRLGNECRFVRITRVCLSDGKWWVAAAEWDSGIYSDPLPTKREAMIIAREIFESGVG
jgi:hypothetical protein